MVAVATLVNEFAIDDLKVLLFTLDLWNLEAPTVYIFSDTRSAPLIREVVRTIKYRGRVSIKEDALNDYTGLNRKMMESQSDIRGKTVFHSFTEEKTKLMEWALREEALSEEGSGESTDSTNGVFFCDADICHLAPLPVISEGVELALSPHMIRTEDTERYGIYNAGYLWFKRADIAQRWREACATSRFFEQACLETLATEFNTYKFPVQVNYGWWRLWQGVERAPILKSQWGIGRQGESTSGITVKKEPLQSIHTHFAEWKDDATYEFNMWVLAQLRTLESVKKTAKLIKFLDKTFRFDLMPRSILFSQKKR